MERKEALSFSSHLKSMILCNCCYLGGKWLQFSRSSVKLTEWYNAAVIALEQGCAVKPMLCKVGAVGAQVMNVQEDVRLHPFLSLPSSLPIWDCSGVCVLAGVSSGQPSPACSCSEEQRGRLLQGRLCCEHCLYVGFQPSPNPTAAEVMADSLASA